MYPPAGRRGSFLLVATLLLISIGLEQCCIVRVLPWLSDLGSVQPMIVFLDIPVPAPVPIDWIPVGLIFIFFYAIVYLPRGTHRDAAMKREMQKKLWGLLTRWCLLLVCILAGGGLFYELSDYLPKQVRNGIDSFGIRADLVLPYPSDERVHLQGSMIMLVFCIIGWRLFVKKAEVPAPRRHGAARHVATETATNPSADLAGGPSTAPSSDTSRDAAKNISHLPPR